MNPIDKINALRPSNRILGLSSEEFWMLVGAIGLVVLIVVIWAVFVRKPKTHGTPYLTDRPVILSGRGRSGRRRRRRREHRPRNPTLAETGGLPRPRSGPSAGL